MSEDAEAGRGRLDVLMYRMLGGVLLLGAAVQFGLILVLSSMPRIETASGAVLVLPGSSGRHVIDAVALPVLWIAAALLGAPSLLAFALGRRQARFVVPPPRRAARARSFRGPAAVLCGGVALLLLALLRR